MDSNVFGRVHTKAIILVTSEGRFEICKIKSLEFNLIFVNSINNKYEAEIKKCQHSNSERSVIPL